MFIYPCHLFVYCHDESVTRGCQRVLTSTHCYYYLLWDETEGELSWEKKKSHQHFLSVCKCDWWNLEGQELRNIIGLTQRKKKEEMMDFFFLFFYLIEVKLQSTFPSNCMQIKLPSHYWPCSQFKLIRSFYLGCLTFRKIKRNIWDNCAFWRNEQSSHAMSIVWRKKVDKLSLQFSFSFQNRNSGSTLSCKATA